MEISSSTQQSAKLVLKEGRREFSIAHDGERHALVVASRPAHRRVLLTNATVSDDRYLHPLFEFEDTRLEEAEFLVISARAETLGLTDFLGYTQLKRKLQVVLDLTVGHDGTEHGTGQQELSVVSSDGRASFNLVSGVDSIAHLTVSAHGGNAAVLTLGEGYTGSVTYHKSRTNTSFTGGLGEGWRDNTGSNTFQLVNNGSAEAARSLEIKSNETDLWSIGQGTGALRVRGHFIVGQAQTAT